MYKNRYFIIGLNVGTYAVIAFAVICIYDFCRFKFLRKSFLRPGNAYAESIF